MEFAQVGYYSDRKKARVPIHRDSIRTCFGRRPEVLRVEFREGYMVLTDPEQESFQELQQRENI